MAVAPYCERVTWPMWFHLIMAMVVGIALASAAGILRRGEAVLFALVPFFGAALVGYVWWRMRVLIIEFGPEGAAYGFGRGNNRVPIESIESATPEEYRVTRYMGWGWRLGREAGDRAYSVIGYPRGVRLIYQAANDRRRSVFLTCSRPDDACDALTGSVRKVSGAS